MEIWEEFYQHQRIQRDYCKSWKDVNDRIDVVKNQIRTLQYYLEDINKQQRTLEEQFPDLWVTINRWEFLFSFLIEIAEFVIYER